MNRVFLHIGQPKTGTTYLQSVLWSHREELRERGLVLPGSGHREHLWAALDLQDRPHLARRDPRAPGTFARLCEELGRLEGVDGLLSHEFFCGASAAQAARAVASLAPAQVHVVITARHAAAMLGAGWQEMVKNGSSLGVREAASDRVRADPEFSWDTWDLAGVLDRWGAAVPADRVHVLPVPGAPAPPSRLWEAFASVVGAAEDLSAPPRAANPSLGAAEVELQRRLNTHLEAFKGPRQRGEWIRGYLAEQQVRGVDPAPFVLPEDLWEDCRLRSRRAVDLIESRGFAVVGDLGRLEVPEVRPSGRTTESVSDAELLDAAGRVVAGLLTDVRTLTQAARADPGSPAAPRALTRARSKVRRWTARR